MIFYSVLSQLCTHVFWTSIFWQLLLVGAITNYVTMSRSTAKLEGSSTTASNLLFTVTNISQQTNPSTATDITLHILEELNTTLITLLKNETDSTCVKGYCDRKCCPAGQLFDTSELSCANASSYGINISTSYDWQNESIAGSETIFQMRRRANAEENFTCGYYDNYDVSVLRRFQEESEESVLKEDFLCNDTMYRFGTVGEFNFACYTTRSPKDKVLIELLHLLHTIRIPLQVTSFISICLLVLLLLMYLASMNKTDLQLKCIAMLGAAMLLRLSVRLFYYIFRENSIFEDRTTCGILAVSRIYTYICVSTCMNIMCFELSRVIRASVKLVPLRELMKSKWRFPAYLIYCWGAPLVICIVTFSLYLPKHVLQGTMLKPNFIPKICIPNPFHPSITVFSTVPITLLFIIDTALMVHIAYLLHKERFCCRKSSPQMRTHASKDYLRLFKQRLYIYLSFLFMKLVRLFGVINYSEKLFVITIILSTSDVVGAMILFTIIMKSKNFSLPKSAYSNLSRTIRRMNSSITSRLLSTNSSGKKSLKTKPEVTRF